MGKTVVMTILLPVVTSTPLLLTGMLVPVLVLAVTMRHLVVVTMGQLLVMTTLNLLLAELQVMATTTLLLLTKMLVPVLLLAVKMSQLSLRLNQQVHPELLLSLPPLRRRKF